MQPLQLDDRRSDIHSRKAKLGAIEFDQHAIKDSDKGLDLTRIRLSFALHDKILLKKSVAPMALFAAEC